MNNYHVYEEIGRGEFSVVYKGRKKKTIEYIAVKSLEKSRKNKILNEVKIFHSLDHPNIMRFYNWYETRNHLWVIFEYCSGGDLLSLIDQDKKLPEPLVKSFARDLTLGLQYLHHKGIIYCDLKPANVLLNEYGQLKICDFGLSRRIVDMITHDEEGKESAKKGAPCYMAPELFAEGGVYSFQGDFWALGCVLFELATGKPPFVSTSFQDIVDKILNEEVPKIGGFSAEFNDLIDRLLQKNPAKRITWDALVSHPFWADTQRFPKASIPNQPHFEAWLALKSQQSAATTSQQSNMANSNNNNNAAQSKQGSSKSPSSNPVNLLRLSLNVQKNMKKELGEQYSAIAQQQSNQPKTKDVLLKNRNQIINIGGRDDDDDDDGGYAEHHIDHESAAHNQRIADEDNRRNIDVDSQFHSTRQPAMETPIHNARNKHQGGGGGATDQHYQDTPTASTIIAPVNELFTHPSDNAVKPIIGNKEIEKVTVDAFKTDQLPFKCYSPEEVMEGIETAVIEQHLESIFNALTQAHTDKFNILGYFETITQNSQVANRLINSAFMNLLLKLLKTVKQVSTKIRIGSILGLLIRHATVIDNELSAQGIPQILIETVKIEKSEKVKRRCMAALGEYLFYGATQMDEDPANSVWCLPGFVLQFFLKIIRSEGEDELVKYYACKTIENITAQSVETGQLFAIQDACVPIAQLYLSSTNEGLKTSCMVSLQHIAMLNNTLTSSIIVTLGRTSGVRDILRDGSSRVQQALLTILNLQVLISESDLTQTILNDLPLIETIVHLLDNQSLVVRGKAILAIFLVIKVNTRALVILAQTKFFSSALEKINRDTQTYVAQCLANLKLLLQESIGITIGIILEEFSRIARGELSDLSGSTDASYYAHTNEYNSVVPKLQGNLQYLQVLLQFATCSQLSPSMFEVGYLTKIFSLLGLMNDLSAEVKSVLVNLYEVLLSNTKALQNNPEFFLGTVVPKLMEQLKMQLESRENTTDTRFNYLKLLVDVSSPFFINGGASNPSSGTSENNSSSPSSTSLTLRIHEFFMKNFVSEKLSSLLSASEPEQVQTMALKLLNLLVDSQPKASVAAIKQLNVINSIVAQFATNPSRITLKIVAKITQYSTLAEIMTFGIGTENLKLFAHYLAKKQDQCYEDIVDIFLSISSKLLGTSSAFSLDKPSCDTTRAVTTTTMTNTSGATSTEAYDYLVQAYELGFSLLNSIDFSLSEKFGTFVIQVVFLFGRFEPRRLSRPEQIYNIIANINQYHMVNTMMRRNTRVLNWISQLELTRDLKEALIVALDKLKSTEDAKVAQNVSEIKSRISK